MASEILRSRCLQQDLDFIKRTPQIRGLKSLEVSPDDILIWKLEIVGKAGTLWSNMEFDLEIKFSRRHPMEAPTITLPPSNRNRSNRAPPSIYNSGRIYLPIVEPDNWVCTTPMIDVIQALIQLFSNETFNSRYGETPCDRLPTVTLQHVLSFLKVSDIGRFSLTNKASLTVVHSDEFWSQLYYDQCPTSNILLNVMSSAGPLRIYTNNGQWSWADARESFIQAYQAGLFSPKCASIEKMVATEVIALEQQLIKMGLHRSHSSADLDDEEEIGNSIRIEAIRQHSVNDPRFKRKWLPFSESNSNTSPPCMRKPLFLIPDLIELICTLYNVNRRMILFCVMNQWQGFRGSPGCIAG